MIDAGIRSISMGENILKSRHLVLPALIAGLLLLVGCTPAGGPPTPSEAVAAPSRTPSQAPSAAPVASRIVVGTQTVDVVAEDGVRIASARYFDPAADLVAALTTAFGAEPVITDQHSGGESAGGTRYTWDTFSVIDHDNANSEPYDPAVSVIWESAAVRGIRIETVSGIAVGDPATPVVDAHPDGLYRSPDGAHFVARVDVVALPENESYGENPSFAVGVVGETNGQISRMFAPVGSWGA